MSKLWENLETDRLLQMRICDLKLDLNHSFVRPCIDQLYSELAKRNLRFRPHIWVSTEWFCPYGVSGFALPFYLLHPRLAELENEYLGEVEGGTPAWCMQLLRHEAGHAIDNAFLLRKSKTRQKLFGLSKTPYPLSYTPLPHSKNFVRHLANNYAQAHPDEDWAETFAVWLDDKSDWKNTYASWPALEKLELLEHLLGHIKGKKQPVLNREMPEHVSRCRETLESYFLKKQKKYSPVVLKKLPHFVHRLFEEGPAYHSYLRTNRDELCQRLVSITKQRSDVVSLAYDQILAVSEKKSAHFNPTNKNVNALIQSLSSHIDEFVHHNKVKIWV